MQIRCKCAHGPGDFCLPNHEKEKAVQMLTTQGKAGSPRAQTEWKKAG